MNETQQFSLEIPFEANFKLDEPLYYFKHSKDCGSFRQVALKAGSHNLTLTHRKDSFYQVHDVEGNSFVASLTFKQGIYKFSGLAEHSSEYSKQDFNLYRNGTNGYSLRPAQSGALYSLLSHWSLSYDACTIVLPTGTGKTETMLVAVLADNAQRVLVVVPTKDLKKQLSQKFETWGMLRQLGVISGATSNPKVLILDRIISSPQDIGSTTEIYFPGTSGDVQATEFNIISDNKIEVTVPSGVGDVSGAIKIVADGDIYYSPAYMFYNQGVFLKTFLETDVLVPGNYTNTKVYSDPVQIAALTGLTNNPDNIMAIPEVAKNIAAATGNGISSNFFKFYAYKGFNKVIANSNGEITKDSNLADLAIQFDLYMKNPWESGAVTFKMNKNSNAVNSQYIYHITPWTATNPYTFDSGWRTITVKFSDFPNLALGRLESYITTITNNNYEALVAFANFDMNNDGHTPKALTNFQMYIANVRLVPTTTPN